MADEYRVNEVSDPWYRYGNVIGVPSRRRTICGVIFILFILALVVIAFSIMSKQNVKKFDSAVPFTAFQSSLNIAVDPCIDFYNFSCGLWAEKNPIPELKYQVSTFSILQDSVYKDKRSIFENTQIQQDQPFVVNSAITFYNLCVDLNGTKSDNSEVLINYFNQMGGWPILNKSSWNEDLFDWFSASAFLIKNLDVHCVIGVSLTYDDKNGTVIYLKLPDLIQDGEPTLTNANEMLYVILYELNSTSAPLEIVADIRKLKEAEAKWFKKFYTFKKHDPMYMTVGELMQQVPEINWLYYFQLIFSDTISEFNETITSNDTIIVENFDFLKKVADVMNSDDFSKEDLANLFGWFVVKDIWILIPGVFQTYSSILKFDFVEQEETLRNQCYELVTSSFSCGIDYLYIKNSSVMGTQESKILTQYVKSAFKGILQKSDWLDAVSKESALSRLNTMEDIIGFPSYLNNKTEFDEVYENFPPVSKNVLKYYLEIQKFYSHIRNLHAKQKNRSWILPRSVTDVGAYYVVQKNAFVLPLALLNPPFFYLHAPAYLNFGAIGSVIGHEIMHGFDTYKSMRGGILKSSFSSASSDIFKKRAECFIDQYNKYDSSGIYNNNGTKTLRENIADTEGLHTAFEAYKLYVKEFGHNTKYKPLKNFTPDQMFFVSYGTVWCSQISPEMKKIKIDSHSFPNLRVNNAVSNLKYFAKAFNCPKGSAMNPRKRCSIW